MFPAYEHARAALDKGMIGDVANCNINAIFFRFLLLKMKKEWRIAPEKR